MPEQGNPKILPQSLISKNQWAAVEHMKAGADSLIFADIGTGKTVMALTFIAWALANLKTVHRVLIVAPQYVARLVWPEEIELWEHTRHLTYGVTACVDVEKRRAIYQNPPQITIVNYEGLVIPGRTIPAKKLKDGSIRAAYDIPDQGLLDDFAFVDHKGRPPTWKKGRPFPYDVLIMDEIDKMAEPDTKRMKKLKRFLRFFKIRIGMTGSPADNSLMDVWGPAHIVSNGAAFGGASFSTFRSEYFYAPDYFRKKWQTLPGSEKRIYAELEDYTYRIALEDEARIEPLHEVEHVVELPFKQRRAYEDMKKKLIAQLDGVEDPVVALSAGVKCNKLVQMAAGFVYDTPDGEERNTHHMHGEKYEKLDEIIGQLFGKQCLIFYQYAAQREILKKKYGKRMTFTLNEATIAAWNRGEIELLALHPRSGAHGLNLHKGGCYNMVFLTEPWSGKEKRQAVGRLRRRGQKKKVLCHIIRSRSTIDFEIHRALKSKHKGNDALLDAMLEATKRRAA